MRLTTKLLLPLSICALAAAAHAQAPDKPEKPDTPAEYSHALPLTVSGKESVVQLRLPQSVYLHARTAQLSDLRVFDADGKALPFSLQAAATRADTSRRDLPVRLFALRGDGGEAAMQTDIDVRRSADGSVLSVTTRGRTVAQAAPLDSLILDLGEASQTRMIDALRFTLPAGLDNYNAHVVLSVSDDLKQWDTIGDGDISWFVNAQAQTLSNNRLQFEPRHFRYARLRWREGKPVQFAKISAESPSRTDVAAPLERLELQAEAGKEPKDLVYRAAIAIPVTRIGLDFKDQNAVMPAALGRYHELPNPKGNGPSSWRFDALHEATFYRLVQGGKVRASGDIAVSPVHVAEWVLRPESAAGIKPTLRLAWTPSTLVFLANGRPPYRLAFGRDDARSAERDIAQVAPGFTAADLSGLEVAVAGPVQQVKAALAEPADAAAKASAAARMRMGILWGALIAGVAVLGYMVWRLLRQMK